MYSSTESGVCATQLVRTPWLYAGEIIRESVRALWETRRENQRALIGLARLVRHDPAFAGVVRPLARYLLTRDECAAIEREIASCLPEPPAELAVEQAKSNPVAQPEPPPGTAALDPELLRLAIFTHTAHQLRVWAVLRTWAAPRGGWLDKDALPAP